LPSIGGYILKNGIIGPMHADDTPDLYFGVQNDVQDLGILDFWADMSDKDQVTVNAVLQGTVPQGYTVEEDDVGYWHVMQGDCLLGSFCLESDAVFWAIQNKNR